jgi:hypothetical protein
MEKKSLKNLMQSWSPVLLHEIDIVSHSICDVVRILAISAIMEVNFYIQLQL